ncbi:RidA family protein [Maribacter algicola]|uniref:RidA family protein n=1 Tax=Maribacter algicola TaxID=2498892 RepID=A0A426RII8_9FLAO|nr:RidA family protein [Maribacter algicola]RRQ48739.1 RidA family protein [Maribacter algicola]
MKYVLPYMMLLGLVISCQPNTGETDNSQAPTPISMGARTQLTKSYIDPGPGYSQAVVVEANGIKTIHISGQVGTGPNFESQFKEALEGLLKTLEHSGASFDDVVKYNTYIVDYQPAYLDTFRTVRKQLLGDKDMPASTLVGVQALGLPEWKVEIDAIAVVERK